MMRDLTKLAACLVVLLLVGCAAPRPEAPPDRAGMTVDLFIANADERTYSRYRMEPDGDLRFAGGYGAIEANFGWQGPLTDDEIVAVEVLAVELVAAGKPAATAGEGPTATLEVRDAAGKHRITYPELSGRTAELHTLLDTASRRRLTPILENLPDAGPQP